MAEPISVRTAAFALVALVACHRVAPEPDPQPSAPPAKATAVPSASPPSPSEIDAIVAFVQKSQREGIAGRDPEAFLRIWTSDARSVGGRREQPEPYDVALDLAAMRASAVAKSRGPADETLTFRYRDVTSQATADEITLRWSLAVDFTAPGESGVDESIEIYRLRRTPEGWRVFYNRYWPVSETYAGATVRYDDALWNEREASLAAARKGGDAHGVITALQVAWHVREGYDAAVKLTAERPKEVRAWRARANLANRLRLIDEAVAAYRQLADLDAKARIPGWVRAHPAWRPAR